jgi:hypothetical protein
VTNARPKLARRPVSDASLKRPKAKHPAKAVMPFS